MSEQDRDKEIREELERAKREQNAPRRKKGGLRRALGLLLVLVVVLGAVAFAAYRDIGSVDSLRRLLSYNKVQQDADGKAELFRYDSDRTAQYAMLGDDLLIVSTTRILLLGSDDTEIFSRPVNLTNPAVSVGAQTAAVYDVGGSLLYLLGARGLVRDMSGESGNGILSAALNASDYLAVTTLKSGYRAAVKVYNAAGETVFELNSSERYVSDACVLSDNRHLAAVTLGEADGVFASRLTIYAFDSEKPVSEATLGGSMVLLLDDLGGTLAALEDDRLTLFDADGALSGSCRYDYPYLRGQSTDGAGFAVLLLSRYRSGSALRVVSVGAEGNILGTLDARREILDVSAAGRYVAVLYSDSLAIYTAELEEYASLADTDYAREVVMRADGTALLIGASRAWLYIPS